MAYSNVREISFDKLDSRYLVDTAGNRNVGRGLTVHNLHASEVALWPDEPQTTMAGLLAAVAPGGAIDIESTPRGLGNYFHQEWLQASAGGCFTPHFFPWWVEQPYRIPLNPGETLEPFSTEERLLIERHQLDLEQIKFRRSLRVSFGDFASQEYAESDAECFLVSGQPVFDVAVIDARLKQVEDPQLTASNGAEQVWFMPQAQHRYIVGADVAEGGEGNDFSAAVVIDAKTGLQCAELLARWPISRFAEELAELGRRYNHALIAVERNNHGHAVLHALERQLHYPRIYCHPTGSLPGGSSAGWPTNLQTKPLAIQCLSEMLRDAPHVFRSKRLLEQCRAYCYREGGKTSAPAGMHDDLVMAMAIALAVRAKGGSIQLLSFSL